MSLESTANDINTYPRIVIAGMSGDSGKTLVSLGLLLALRERGIAVRAYKKGPDYIDTAWLSWASAAPVRNLDTWLMGVRECASSFSRSALASGFNLVEGNRGLFDGVDAAGTHSTAELAKILKAPVLLIVNAAKATRTIAAGILGCQKLDPQVHLAGVILNRVNGPRHESIVREAVKTICELPVLGVVRKIGGQELLPARHLGLVTTQEHPHVDELKERLRGLVRDQIDLDQVLDLARRAPTLPSAPAIHSDLPDARGLRAGVIKDAAFSFYYPENLEALERSGATLVHVSPLSSSRLPSNLDILYIGGGFPETHGPALSANRDFLAALQGAALSGLPVYAECGGLMLLSQAIRWKAARYPMAGVFPFEIEIHPDPQGHGYVELMVDGSNPFFRQGKLIRGHEFHYSRIVGDLYHSNSACVVLRGTGCGRRRDGLVLGNVWASYTHVHALGTPEWAQGLIQAAARHRDQRRS